MTSDLSLIQTFIQDSVARKETLLANRTLQAIGSGGHNQLSSKKAGLLVRTEYEKGILQFSVKFSSSYSELIGQALAETGFLPNDDIQNKDFRQDQHSFLKYFPYKLPNNYSPHCTKAIDLWKMWWRYAKRIRNQPIPIELVIRKGHSWLPVKDIFVTEGLLYIQTLPTHMTLHSEDLIFWLNKTACKLSESPQLKARTDLAGNPERFATPARV